MRMKIMYFFLGFLGLHCSSGPRIIDRPISFSPWRIEETKKYIFSRYGVKADTIEMRPIMVVVHYTASDDEEGSFRYLNNEKMPETRPLLKDAGEANIAVQFLVNKQGKIFRLMPENHIGRHVIGLNRYAIGIENIGAGEKSLTSAQVMANAELIRYLKKKYPIEYVIGHSEYRRFEGSPLWEEKDNAYRTEKFDPGDSFMIRLRHELRDLNFKSVYDGSEISGRLAHFIETLAQNGTFNGVIRVEKNGALVYEKALGVKDPRSKKSLDLSDRFYIASMSKQFTSMAIMRLVEQNKLKLESSVSSFFPEWKNFPKNLTIESLLTHRSGLEDYYHLVPVKPGFSNADALAVLGAQKKWIRHSTEKFYYSNSNYVLLSEIISRITKQSYIEFLRQQIFDPLQMTSSFVRQNTHDNPSVLSSTGVDQKPFDYAFLTTGAGGIFSTVADLKKWDDALCSHQLVSETTWKKMTSPLVLAEKKSTHYGLGWYVYPEKGIIYHDGNLAGFQGINWLKCNEGSKIIILTNRFSGKIKWITHEIDKILHGMRSERLD